MADIEFEQFFKRAIFSKPRIPLPQWAEENVVLGYEDAMPGRYRIDNAPFVKEIFEAAQSPMTTDLVLKCGRQSTKTQDFMIILAEIIAADPGPSMWTMPAIDEAKSFCKRRLIPFLKRCKALKELMPTGREDDTILEQAFDEMTLYSTGVNAPSKLMQRPIRYLFLDEIGAYRDAAKKHTNPVEIAKQTTTTFWNAKRFYSSTVTLEGDEIDVLFKWGDQQKIYLKCPGCGHAQVMRWGKPEEPGGFKWDTNETTKPNGEWNYREVKKTVRYECEIESCQHRIAPDIGSRRKFYASYEWRSHNPNAPIGVVSFFIPQFYMIWKKWEDLVEQFLRAKEAAKNGDMDLLKAFTQYVLAEGWKEEGTKPEEQEILDRKGDYLMGQRWPHADDKSVIVFTVDVQLDHVWILARCHRKGFGSGMVWCGRLPGLEDVREKQLEMGVHNRSVWLDVRYRRDDVYDACILYGWRPLMGEDATEFAHSIIDASGKNQIIKRPWRRIKVDPYAGKNKEGRFSIYRYSWSNPSYKERVYLRRMRGKGLVFNIPKDAPRTYIAQVQAEERMAKEAGDGSIYYEWVRTSRANHLGDCECMQEAVADMAGMTRGAVVQSEQG